MSLYGVFWFHFHKLRYAHYRSSFVSVIGMQSFKAVTPIEKAGETMKVVRHINQWYAL